jgi:SAM-dependent methyltransferase
MSEVDNQSNNVLREWRDNAEYWREHYPTIRTMFAPVTRALVEEAKITAGNVILDVAGGSGEPSLTIAQMVGPTGSVTCTDAVAEMVSAAKSEALQRGLTNIEFRQCLADSLPFENKFFNATVCRLGVMFFPDVPAALREMLRVTKAGGTISLVVWGRNEVNPFTNTVTNVIAKYVEMPPVSPDDPGAFRFAEPGKLAKLLREAGTVEVRERQLDFKIEAPLSPAQFWKLRSETSGTLREKLSSLSPEQVRQVMLEVQEAVREFFPNGEMSFPAQMLIVSGNVS